MDCTEMLLKYKGIVLVLLSRRYAANVMKAIYDKVFKFKIIWKPFKTDIHSVHVIYFANEVLSNFTPSVLLVLFINYFLVRASARELLWGCYC